MGSLPASTDCITIDGPWTHRLVRANGCQIHLAHMGEHSDARPLVLLIHGFPQYWWAWRNHIEPLAAAGYEVAAIDVRGHGGSDKTPDIVDALTLAQDIPALARALGATSVVAVGHGRGAQDAWAAATLEPGFVRGALAFSSAHPLAQNRLGMHVTFKTWKHVLRTFAPALASKALRDEAKIGALLAEWSAPGNAGAASQAERYAAAMRLPQACEMAIEQLRWSYASFRHASAVAYRHALAGGAHVPVWTVRGDLDPLLPERLWFSDRSWARAGYRHITIDGAGHFVPEEAPERTTEIILDFLARLASNRER